MGVQSTRKRFQLVDGQRETPHTIHYEILSFHRCVFSMELRGDSGGLSSLNMARRIIEQIAAREGLDPQSTTWCDLQTHRGYTYRDPGQYELEVLELTPQQTVQGMPVACPEDVMTLFADLIGPNPRPLVDYP